MKIPPPIFGLKYSVIHSLTWYYLVSLNHWRIQGVLGIGATLSIQFLCVHAIFTARYNITHVCVLRQGNVLHLFVSHSVHRGEGVSGRHTPGRHPLPQADTPRVHPQADTPWADPPRANTPQADPPGQTPPSPGRWLLQRTVCILPECFLVGNNFAK